MCVLHEPLQSAMVQPAIVWAHLAACVSSSMQTTFSFFLLFIFFLFPPFPPKQDAGAADAAMETAADPTPATEDAKRYG